MGLKIILFLPGFEMMKCSVVVDVWVGVSGGVLMHAITGQWQFLIYGSLWWMLQRPRRKRTANICRDGEQILWQMKESMV